MTLDQMTCEEAFRRIDQFVDRELAAEERDAVAHHLAICAACATEFAFEESVVTELRAKLPRVVAPGDLRERILAALKTSR